MSKTPKEIFISPFKKNSKGLKFMINIPDNYQIIDFKNYAELFDQVIYDES